MQLPVIDERDALPIDGTNPMLPVVAVGVGVLLAFLALIFAVDNVQVEPSRAVGGTAADPLTAGGPGRRRDADRHRTCPGHAGAGSRLPLRRSSIGR